MSTLKAMLSRARLDRRRPLRDQIYPIIRDLILTGSIKPGDSIDEKALALQLNISRTPVREAVKKLSDEHLVEVVAQSGTRAARIDAREIEQAFLIRRALEMESAGQAAPRLTSKSLQDLKDNLVTHERALSQKEFVKAISIDDQFHHKIAEIAELPRLWHMIEISKAHLDRCRHMLVPRTGEAEAVLRQHSAIIAAIATGKTDLAREAMRDHLETSYKGIAKMLAET